MPIRIPRSLPAYSILESEKVFVMSCERADHQDVRPIKIVILNLMPAKIMTETQLLRCLSNSPLQIEIEFLQTHHECVHTPPAHLAAFYKTFDDVKDKKYDGMIISGAPVEKVPFEKVDFWMELCDIMDFSRKNIHCTLHICWGAFAGLYYHYGINKYQLPSKCFGVFKHDVLEPKEPLFRGFDDVFLAPHSRHTEVKESDIKKCLDLKLLSTSSESGVYVVCSKDNKLLFVTGHSEYESNTLDLEYQRDLAAGLSIALPKHYYRGDDPAKGVTVGWRAHSVLLFTNWLNYYVYQTTPYDLSTL